MSLPHTFDRLITLYQIVHDALHARSGQEQGPLKLQCVRTEKEIIMGWVSFIWSPLVKSNSRCSELSDHSAI